MTTVWCHWSSDTVFHYVALIAVGLFAAMNVHLAEKEPSVLAGALILFVATKLGPYALSAALAEWQRAGGR